MTEQKVSPLPWRVKLDELTHRKGSNACAESCGKGQTPLRVSHDDGGGFGETELHTFAMTDSVEDIIDANGAHVVCFGHDYDDYGNMGAVDAEYIVRACNSYPALRSALQTLIEEMKRSASECGVVSSSKARQWAETLTSLIGEDESTS